MYLKKYGELYVPSPVPMGRMSLGGEFRCVLLNSMGGIVQDTGWFHNLITNGGLTYLGNQNWFTYLHIGSGAAAPAFSNTALSSWLAVHNTLTSQVDGPAPVGPNYEFYETRAFRFNVGVGTGTVRELGLSHSSSNTNMSIRALVSPEVVKASNQVLDVYYRFKIWPSLTDIVGVTSIAGENYNYTIRSKELDVALYSRAFDKIQFSSSGSSCHAMQDNIGSITGAPVSYTGSGGSSNSELNAPVISAPVIDTALGTGYVDTKYKFALDEGNSAGGIRSIMTTYLSTLHTRGVQCQFNRVSDSAKIPKDNTKELEITFRLTYTR